MAILLALFFQNEFKDHKEGERMKTKKLTYVKFGIDLIMAVMFVLFFNKRVLGGLTFHEIAGLVMAAFFFTHVLLNWRWVKNITLKLFDRKLPGKTKLGYFLNLMLLISMGFIIVSGIFISRVVFPNIDIGNEPWFKITHISVSFLTLILVALHVGLHWKWVVNCFKNILQIKSKKPILSILAKAAASLLLVFGIYQMISSHFFTHLQGVAMVFHPDAVSDIREGGFRDGGRPEFNGDKRPELPEGFTGDRKSFERHDFSEGKGNEGFKGRQNHHGGSANPLEVIISYFSIMAVFIIAVYYIEKFFKNRKKKKHMSGPSITPV